MSIIKKLIYDNEIIIPYLNKYPIDIISIINALGYKVYKVKAHRVFYGRIRRIDNTLEFYVNEADNFKFQRFILARLLYYYLKYESNIENKKSIYNNIHLGLNFFDAYDTFNKKIELESISFANELLMPEHDIARFINKLIKDENFIINDNLVIREIRERYGVTNMNVALYLHKTYGWM